MNGFIQELFDTYLSTIKKYNNFQGRSQLKEYWKFFLANIIVSIGVNIFDVVMRTEGLLIVVYAIVIVLPGIALTVRRLHDLDKSGWYMLILLIPFVGPIWFLVLMLKDGSIGDNRFGHDPQDTEIADYQEPTFIESDKIDAEQSLTGNISEMLRQLAKLKDDSIISEDEFNTKKQELLSRI